MYVLHRNLGWIYNNDIFGIFICSFIYFSFAVVVYCDEWEWARKKGETDKNRICVTYTYRSILRIFEIILCGCGCACVREYWQYSSYIVLRNTYLRIKNGPIPLASAYIRIPTRTRFLCNMSATCLQTYTYILVEKFLRNISIHFSEWNTRHVGSVFVMLARVQNARFRMQTPHIFNTSGVSEHASGHYAGADAKEN